MSKILDKLKDAFRHEQPEVHQVKEEVDSHVNTENKLSPMEILRREHDEYIQSCIKGLESETLIIEAILKDSFPDENIKVSIDQSYLNKEYCSLVISWVDGYNKCRISEVVEKELDPFCNGFSLNGDFSYLIHGLQVSIVYKRSYSEDIIHEASRKYADCISKDLPLNMHNIHCFKVGNVSLYDLAVGELDLKDVV